MLNKPERGACLAAFPFKEGDDAARAECKLCGDAVGLDPANVPVVKQFDLTVICVSCAAIALTISEQRGQPFENRGRLVGGVPIDQIAKERRKNN